MNRRGAPIDGRDRQFDEVAKPDRADQRADDDLHRPEATLLDRQQAVCGRAGDRHAAQQRTIQEQRQPDRGAEKFGQIRRHRRDFADDPQQPDERAGIDLAAELGQIAAGDDAKLGRERLKQHRDDIGREHHPQQRIAVARARLNVGREIAWIDIGDRDDQRRTGKQKRPETPRVAVEGFADRVRRPHRHARGNSSPIHPSSSLACIM
jgi:hypothetical protein